MGIILTTPGWTGATIAVVHPSGNATYTVDVHGDEDNAYTVATAFAAWLDAGARPWAAAVTALAWTVQDNGDGRVCFVYAATGTNFTSFTCGGAAATRIRVSKTSTSSGASGSTIGSCSALPGTVMWDRWDTDSGMRNRIAPWRSGHGLYSHRRPSVELFMDLEQAYAFGEAIRTAAQPRRGYLYDEMSDTWRFVTIGKHSLAPHTGNDTTMMAGTLDVLGGV